MAQARKVTVAIDGPAGAGKSTVAKCVAQALGYALVDTGAIYRAVALLARQHHVAWDDDAGLVPLVQKLRIAFSLHDGENHVLICGEDVTLAIRTADISKGASVVSSRPLVRAGLLQLQRDFAGAGAAVLEGRDIGTVVCPDAPVKFFLDASAEERARRRFEELRGRDDSITFEAVFADLRDRDDADRRRSVAPLRPAADARCIDCTRMPAQEVIDLIVAAARAAEAAA